MSIGPSVLNVKDHVPHDKMSAAGDNYGVAQKKKPKRGKPARRRKIDPWDAAFGQRLKNARGTRISQQEMADYLGLPVNTYQKYERGARSFPKDLIPKVVAKTGHGPWLLLTGSPDNLCPAYQPPTDTRPTNPLPGADSAN